MDTAPPADQEATTDGGDRPSDTAAAPHHAHFPPVVVDGDDEGGGAMSDSERSLTKRMDRRTWTGPPLLDRIRSGGGSLTEPDALIVSFTPPQIVTHVPHLANALPPGGGLLTVPDSLVVSCCRHMH
jgi:hypothetical protein